MSKSALFILTAAIFSTPVLSQMVYRCPADDGSTIFSDTPCAENPDISFINPNQNVLDSSGHRRQPTNHDFQQSSRHPPSETPAHHTINTGISCGDFVILEFSTYERKKVSGGIVTGGIVSGGIVTGGEVSGGRIYTTRCANVMMKMNGYGSRLNNDNYTSRLSTQILAQLANGDVREGRRLRITAGNRIELGETYRGSVCFGTSDHEIVHIQCK